VDIAGEDHDVVEMRLPVEDPGALRRIALEIVLLDRVLTNRPSGGLIRDGDPGGGTR
jgi:hypothetical protein